MEGCLDAYGVNTAYILSDERSSIIRIAPRVQLLLHRPLSFPSSPHRSRRYNMAALESLVDGIEPPNIADRLAAAASLNADIQSLITSKDRIDTHPLKVVFESVVAILTLVRVRFLVQFSFFFCQLMDDTTRTRW